MSWQERDHADDPMRNLGRPGGDWGGLRPRFDNPMSWSVAIFRASGITVRVHIFFLLYILIELGRSLAASTDSPGPSSMAITAIMLAALFTVVLLHEFGHCYACRLVRGEADEILMWPLGGLAFCQPPQHWKAHLITAIGGPMVNVVILSLTIPMLGMITGEWLSVAVPNPFVLLPAYFYDEPRWTVLVLYALNYVSFVLLLFNLLPIFPLDGGRIVQAALWKSMGYTMSMRYSVYAGYIGAILLFVVGFIMGEMMLVMISIMGGVTCYLTLKQVEYTNEFMGYEDSGSYAFAAETPAGDGAPALTIKERREQKRLERERQQAAVDDSAMDDILKKISASGIDSLSGPERKILDRVTRRKREES
jgi:Zn-dependent protease